MKNDMGNTLRGLTTIEFVVVALFVGVLAFIAYAVFSDTRINERDEVRVRDIQTLQVALDEYFSRKGGYPSSLEKLIEEEKILSFLPRDPKTREEYLYAPLNAGCTSYHLGAKLENREHGVLLVDIDAEKGTLGTECPDGGIGTEDFSGTGPLYDVKP